MKTTTCYIALLLLFAFSNINAQSFSLQTLSGNAVNNGDTIVLSSPSLFASLTGDLLVLNNSGATKFVVASKTYLNVLPGTFDVFSFDTWCCLSPFVFVIPGAVEMTPGGGPKNFNCNYQDNGIAGSSFIRYSFYDENNISDKIDVVFHFEVMQATGLSQNSGKVDFSAFPNPSKGNFKVKALNKKRVATEADIYDGTGQLVIALQVSDLSVFDIDLSTHPKGIYTVVVKNSEHEIIGNLKLIRD